jgi:uncharacterized membrane protein HdeD (DUF308 family)
MQPSAKSMQAPAFPFDFTGNTPSGTQSTQIEKVPEATGVVMIILGLIILIVGFLLKIAILWTIGIIVLVIGLILLLLGALGHAVGGRRHYW